MRKSWIAEGVSGGVFKARLENFLYQRDGVAWGPNRKLKFPPQGGRGGISRRVANCFRARVQTGKELVEVDSHRRRVSFADGTGDTYDNLISTVPLDLLVQMMRPSDDLLLEAAGELKHNSLLVLGIGLARKI